MGAKSLVVERVVGNGAEGDSAKSLVRDNRLPGQVMVQRTSFDN